MPLLLLLLFSFNLYAQEDPEILENPKADPMEEFIALSGRHASLGLPAEDLFRLANLYLRGGIYPKSAELYAELIHMLETRSSLLSEEQRSLFLARSHFNRGLALFTLELYESAKVNFERAFYYNDTNIESLRMLGSIAFAQQNKENALSNWTEYVNSAEEGPVRDSVQKAIDLLNSPGFNFQQGEEPPPNPSWPFRNYEAVPYPDALYEKKRVI